MTSQQISTIELFKENMKFSIAHFTIFSETERENLHGHNYNVYVGLKTLVDVEKGLSFDYRYYKQLIYTLCSELNQFTLIPLLSRYLKIEKDEQYLYVTFNKEKMIFLHRDVKCMPMQNISVEALSQWFVNRLSEDTLQLDDHQIQGIDVKVFSAPGQSGSANFVRN